MCGPARVPLNRALSKLGILSRSQAIAAILEGRVKVSSRIVRDPGYLVVPERGRIALDDERQESVPWRTVVLHKPRGVVTTRRDPEGRRTVHDVMAGAAAGDVRGLNAVGRLDLATTGLLMLTTDTQLAAWITDPANAVPRVYLVTVKGEVSDDDALRLQQGVESRGEMLRAAAVTCRKRSRRESHFTLELHEGRNREVRRLFDAIEHPVTRLKRVRLGGLELRALEPGQWREVLPREVRAAFPQAPISAPRPPLNRARSGSSRRPVRP
jgi:23S rRNA pseudouridine2605 synthase